MVKNIIYYGPPGTGKTYFMQKETEKYTNYSIKDEAIRSIYVKESEEWLLFALVILQSNTGMSSPEILTKVKTIIPNFLAIASDVLQEHSLDNSSSLITQKTPQIFHEENGLWYVNRLKLLEFQPDFFYKYFDKNSVLERYGFVTFHQSFSYEDFVEGIRPNVDPVTNHISYDTQDGIFKKISDLARKDPKNEYAIFIDEINRGNISEIFGELISLIEVDKREKMPAELKVVLPYSKKKFSVPANLNIIGTMNSADRSIAHIDMALRRRFEFIPFKCDYDLLKNELIKRNVDPTNVEGIDVIKLLKVINMRIELFLDSNFIIGHAYFININDFSDVKNVIVKKIIPLLEEYFFDDLQKAQMVFNDLDEYGELDPNPVYIHKIIESENILRFTEDYMNESKNRYYISPVINKESIRKIYNGVQL